MFNIKFNFINYILRKGKKNLSEKIYKNSLKQLLQYYNKKSSKKFIQIYINFFLVIFRNKDKKFGIKKIYLLSNKISFSIKFIVNKFIYNKKINILLNLKNLSLEKNKLQIDKSNYKKIIFYYRW